MFKKLLFGLVAALFFSFNAHASIPPTTSTEYNCGYGWAATVGQALAGWGGYNQADFAGGPYQYDFGSCTVWRKSTSQYVIVNSGSTRSVSSCPANSTLVGAVCECSSGYNQVGNICVNAQCEVGKGRTFNRTEGWARSTNADGNDVVSNVGPPAGIYDYNDGVCVGNITGIDRCYRSQEPSTQGLYRISCDYTMVVTGEASGAGDTAAQPTTPNASCPGFVGEVNGKTVCVGTATNPLPVIAAPNEPTVAGNPPAGVKPSTGQGSGSTGADRTPTTGSGGNDGGPASAAVGRGGTGVRGEAGQDGEDAKAVCGAAPLPACAVKVDETGVPAEGTASGRFGQANSDVDGTKGEAESFLGGIEDIALPGWTWTFLLPTGCSPYPMEGFGFSVDVCEFQPVIHDLMSFLWLSATIFGLIALFRSNVGV